MRKLILIAILAGAVWYGNAFFQQHGLGVLNDFWTNSPDTATKCIASDGSVIYGEVPEGVVCERVERVSGSLTILDSKTSVGGGQQSREGNSDASGFRCDGRVYCSQMRSCAEARFFLSHCPDVKMDGNNDGVPCERQWCN